MSVPSSSRKNATRTCGISQDADTGGASRWVVLVSHRAQATGGELLRSGLEVGPRFWGADPHSSQPQLFHLYVRKGFREN